MRSDFDIQQAVIAELLWQPALKAAQLGVAVKHGVVMLSGITDSYYKKVLAEKAVRKVAGVRAVAEEIEVKVPGGHTRTDVDIAEAVANALAWNSSVDESRLTVKVEKGEVTLEGEVEWNFQKVAAHKAVESLVGVRSLINNIRVKNRVSAVNVKEQISEALMRHAVLDSENIVVEVQGEKITLSGKVRSWAEWKDAERTAWASPGIVEVENRLEIDPQMKKD